MKDLMDGWSKEKATQVVHDLAEFVADVLPNVPEPDRENARLRLSGMLWNALKLVAWLEDAAWAPTDADLIIKDGLAGFGQVMARYKMKAPAGYYEPKQ